MPDLGVCFRPQSAKKEGNGKSQQGSTARATKVHISATASALAREKKQKLGSDHNNARCLTQQI